MREKLDALWDRTRMVVLENPVEVLMSAVTCLLGCYQYGRTPYGRMLLFYFPVLFLLTYTLNRRGKGGKIRMAYFLCAALCPVFMLLPSEWYHAEGFTPTYLVSLVVVQLVYLASKRACDNKTFMRDGLLYLRSLFSAGLLASIAWGVVFSIYESIQYIFDIWTQEDSRIISYITYVAYYLTFPLLFLMFNQREEKEGGENRLFDVLLNYILSPALLIYAVILYLYFIKIAVTWSLPKGAVAYIVVSFTSATFLLKGCQSFLSRRYYDWYYNHASLAVLPALVMYWIGSCYRIQEYGFTVPRVYLVVTGLVLTGIAILFLSRRWGRYLFASYWAAGLLALVTYIPGITALDIERVSQAARGNDRNEEVFPEYLDYINIMSNKPLDIKGYSILEEVSNYGPENGWVSLRFNMDSLSIFGRDGNLMYHKATDEFLDEQLAKVGLTRQDSIPESVYPELLQIELDSGKFILEHLELTRDSLYHIHYTFGRIYLKR